MSEHETPVINDESTKPAPSAKDKSKAYARAATLLREQHQGEFDAFLVQEYAKIGYEWAPRPSPEQKARAQIAALLAEFPALKEQDGPAEPRWVVAPS